MMLGAPFAGSADILSAVSAQREKRHHSTLKANEPADKDVCAPSFVAPPFHWKPFLSSEFPRILPSCPPNCIAMPYTYFYH